MTLAPMTCAVDKPLYNRHDTLGDSVPTHTPHAISVSLPTWADYVGYLEGEARVMDVLNTGYPRFYMHLSVRRLAQVVEEKLGKEGELCLLLQTARMCQEWHMFMKKQSTQQKGSVLPLRIVDCHINGPFSLALGAIPSLPSRLQDGPPLVPLHAVFCPAASYLLARRFWQYTGNGITSRFAEHCLAILFPDEDKVTAMPWTHALPSSIEPLGGVPMHIGGRDVAGDIVENAEAAKGAIRQRLVELERSDATVDEMPLSPSDVYLFPTGMQAIVAAHKIAQAFRPDTKSVCFGFSYLDMVKVLENFGSGIHFLGHGRMADLSDLLAAEALPNAVFTECPHNPLLDTPDFRTLRAIADQYDLLIVVDATIGNMCNVDMLPYADIVVHSLSKIFSARGDVTGGSLMLNPSRAHYATLKAHLSLQFEDSWFDTDVLMMERNSRAVEAHVAAVNANGEAIADFLRLQSLAGGAAGVAIKEVFYPKWTSRAEYDAVRRRARTSDLQRLAYSQADSTADGGPNGGDNAAPFVGGFSGLLSITFVSMAASRAFFDALACYKGGSFGARFTLACPYTIVAHYREMEWVAKYGVEEGLVRISAGCEERAPLMRAVRQALVAAQEAVDQERMVRGEKPTHEGKEEDGAKLTQGQQFIRKFITGRLAVKAFTISIVFVALTVSTTLVSSFYS